MKHFAAASLAGLALGAAGLIAPASSAVLPLVWYTADYATAPFTGVLPAPGPFVLDYTFSLPAPVAGASWDLSAIPAITVTKSYAAKLPTGVSLSLYSGVPSTGTWLDSVNLSSFGLYLPDGGTGRLESWSGQLLP